LFAFTPFRGGGFFKKKPHPTLVFFYRSLPPWALWGKTRGGSPLHNFFPPFLFGGDSCFLFFVFSCYLGPVFFSVPFDWSPGGVRLCFLWGQWSPLTPICPLKKVFFLALGTPEKGIVFFFFFFFGFFFLPLGGGPSGGSNNKQVPPWGGFLGVVWVRFGSKTIRFFQRTLGGWTPRGVLSLAPPCFSHFFRPVFSLFAPFFGLFLFPSQKPPSFFVLVPFFPCKVKRGPSPGPPHLSHFWGPLLAFSRFFSGKTPVFPPGFLFWFLAPLGL